MILIKAASSTNFSRFSKQELHDFRYDAKIALMRQLLDVLEDADYHNVKLECSEELHPEGIQYFFTCVLYIEEEN